MVDRSSASSFTSSPLASNDLRVACANCSLRELCLSAGLDVELGTLDALVSSRSQLREGEALFRSGDPFRALFALRRGFLKSTVSTADGREQVTGFHMTGDVVGLDAIPDARHRVDAVALEVTEVCVIGYEDFSDIADHLPTLQKNLARIMGQRIAGDHRTICSCVDSARKRSSHRSC